MDLYSNSYLNTKKNQTVSEYYTQTVVLGDENLGATKSFFKRNKSKLLVVSGIVAFLYSTFGVVIVNSYSMKGSKWKWIRERNLALDECRRTIENAFEDNIIKNEEVQELESNIEYFLKKAYGTRRYMDSIAHGIKEMSIIEYLKIIDILQGSHGSSNERYGKNITFLYLMQREKDYSKRLEYVNSMSIYHVKEEKVKRYYDSLRIFSSYMD